MIFRWRFYVGKRPMNYMDDDEAGGEDPKMNSCNPSHVRLHRSNCDCKVVMNKFGPAMYVTKGAAEYACKMEVASQDYEAIYNEQTPDLGRRRGSVSRRRPRRRRPIAARKKPPKKKVRW